jgi:glycerophosphoryl diester phosphodiesterase
MSLKTYPLLLPAGLLLCLVLAPWLFQAGQGVSEAQTVKKPVKIIAHRGGVVGDTYAENSPAALEAAIERGYWMIEVDIRESKDGRLVVQHDPDFGRFFGDSRLVSDMRWEEIRNLKATPGNSRPLEFHELAAMCRGKLELMLDTKPPDHPEAFYRSMEQSLRENGLLEGAYVIGTEESRAWFHGKARIGIDRQWLKKAEAAGEDAAKLYFLFEHGRDLDAETVRYAQKLGVAVVPSINIFHYADTDHMKAAEADVRRMYDLSVEYFQIDSPYDVWLR